MKSVKLLFTMVFLLVSSVFAQDMQYVSSQSGDTLVVKDDIEFNGTNTLYLLMQSDSMAPASRVYMLQNYGLYSCANNPVTSSDYKTIIMGPTQTSLKVNQGDAPPIITGDATAANPTFGGMNIGKDLLIKNVDLEIGNTAGNGGGWAYFNFNSAGLRLQVDNCIMEHTWWVWVGGPPADSRVFFTNDYFVNLDGHSCRRNGGVTDFNGTGVVHQDTLSVQNCTHVNIQGTLYKFRTGVAVDKVLFNHNDFIDCAGFVFMDNGDQTNMSETNNIFVNVQLQAFCPVLISADAGEVDPDGLPMGLVNVRVDSTFNANGKNFYADRNLAYWDPSLSDIVSTLNNNQVNGSTEWVSQMIIMNSRTESLFTDKTNYPLLTNGKWYDKLPNFKNTDVLFNTQLAKIKAYAIAAVDTSYGSPLDSWRQSGNPEASNFVYADWPIPIDLSYDDADLMTAGLSGLPLGDLNWFPSEYATWAAQEADEHTYIAEVLDGTRTVGVSTTQGLPQKFQLQQNYPNPFNPTTQISYTIAKAGNVTLKVFNMLGQEVATLVNGFQAANTYNVNFNASNLASGVYIYELSAGSNIMSKKMVLMK
ncbi:MAG: T9SS type A sorting domain-containing protein [Ignavibacteriaceae bacterium]